jgi:translocation and assembly module TamA
MVATIRVATRRLALLALSCLLAGPVSAELALNGIQGEIKSNALAHMHLDDEPCSAPAWRIQQEYKAAPDELRTALDAYGYYDAKISTSLTRNKDCWSATIDVELGQPVRIRKLDFTFEGAGKNDPVYKTAIAEFPLAKDLALNQGVYEQYKKRLLDIANRRGYADAAFAASRIDVYPDEHAADVTLHFDSGPRYAFGPIQLSQNVLVDGLVKGYLGFAEGEPYDAARLSTAYVQLTDSGYFKTVTVRPQAPNPQTHQIPVTVELTPAPAKQISYGVGFSTDTGPHFRFSRNNRRYNDKGHQFEIDLQLSPVDSELNVNYRYPYGDPRMEWMSLDGGVKREKTDTSLSKTLEFGARRVIERPHDWTRTELLSLRLENFEVADQKGRTRLLMPGVTWTRLKGKDTVRPRNGSKLDFQLRGASDSLGSDTSFLQAYIHGKWIHSVLHGSRVLLRGELGVTEESSFMELPPSVRFFAGGDNSVRGYAFQSLGPVDKDGKVIGGSRLVTASIEFEHPLVRRWSLAMFVDSGNAFTGHDFTPMTGAGLGARWQSPLGPIRIDVGVPIHAGERGPRLHISLGPDL